MLRALVRKEILDNLLSLRFVFAYCLVTVLLVGSASIMLGQYLTQKKTHDLSSGMFRMRESEGVENTWASWTARHVSRSPLVTQILAVGTEKDPDRWALVHHDLSPDFFGDLRRNPLGNLFPAVDMVFVVGVVFSLVVFMLAYDSICGEREQGTFRVLLAAPVPRDTVLLGKWLGGFISLALPFVTSCVLIALVLLIHPSVTMTPDDWARTVAVFAVCLLYLAVTFSLATAVSVILPRASSAALVLLLVWIGWFVGLPLLAAPLAQAIVPPAGVHQTELAMVRLGTLAYRERDDADRLANLRAMGVHKEKEIANKDRERFNELSREQYVKSSLLVADTMLLMASTEMEHRQAVDRIAQWIARLSPYGCLQNTCLAIAGTGLQRESDLQRAMAGYYRLAVELSSRQDRRIISAFQEQRTPLRHALRASIIDLSVLAALGVLLFMTAYVGFLRQDLT